MRPAGTLRAGRFTRLASKRRHGHAGVDRPAGDLGGHRALGREGRDGRHRGEEDVDVLVQRRDLLDEPAPVVLDRGLPRQRLRAECAPAGGDERVELVEPVLPEVGVDADELVDAFHPGVRQRVVVELDGAVDERGAGGRDEGAAACSQSAATSGSTTAKPRSLDHATRRP